MDTKCQMNGRGDQPGLVAEFRQYFSPALIHLHSSHSGGRRWVHFEAEVNTYPPPPSTSSQPHPLSLSHAPNPPPSQVSHPKSWPLLREDLGGNIG